MAIEESKDLTSLSLDELIRNLKVHEMIIKKDSEIVKAKREKKSLAFKAKKESSDEESLTLGSKDEEYAMAVRDFKKFFKRRGRCGDPNHRIEECLKPPRDKNQRAFVRGSWSNIDKKYDENANDETCLMAQASSEVKVIFLNKNAKLTKDGKVDRKRTLGHVNMRLIQSLASKELVRNLPKLKFKQKFYDAFKIGKRSC
ncbi:hypothetical protein Tco_0138265 [Tanacetum coccineum]